MFVALFICACVHERMRFLFGKKTHIRRNVEMTCVLGLLQNIEKRLEGG